MLFSRSFIFACLGAPLLAFAQSTANPPKVPVIAANNAQNFSATAGSPLTLDWTPTTPGTVTLQLRTGASNNLDQGMTIISKIPNSGSYTWQVPSSIAFGSQYTIEIISDSDPSATNFWPYFVIYNSNNVAATTTAILTSGAPTTSVSLSTASPSSGVTALTGTHSTSGTASTTGTSSVTGSSSSGSASHSMTTSTTSSSSVGMQSATTSPSHGVAPRATAMAGLLGVVALGALVL